LTRERPLAAASRRLRRRSGRPRSVRPSGPPDQGAALGPALDAASRADFATSLLPRAFPLRVTVTKAKLGQPAVRAFPATAYSGIPVRTLLRLIAAGRLRPIRVPGMGRLLLDRLDLDALLEASKRGEACAR
jgi:excisionase family DNA binding protein